MHYLIQKSHRFLAIVSPNKHCNVSICDYFYIISIAGRKCFRVSYGYGKDFPPMHGLKPRNVNGHRNTVRMAGGIRCQVMGRELMERISH